MNEPQNINVDGDNNGNVAGRDIVVVQNQSSALWFKQRKALDEVMRHFGNFFSLADDINDKTRRVVNPIRDAKDRLKRDLDLNLICDLQSQHQKEIYQMHRQLMAMKHASECSPELQKIFRNTLSEISVQVDSDSR